MARRAASTMTGVVTKSFSDIPGPTSFPLIGSPSTVKFTTAAIEKYHEELISMYHKYGPICKETYPLGFGSVVHVFTPGFVYVTQLSPHKLTNVEIGPSEDARATFQSDGKQPYIVPLQSTTQRYRQLRGMNPGLGNLNGEEWYRLRSAVQQAMMRPEAVHEYLPYVNEVAERLNVHIAECQDESGEADMQTIAGRWSLESAGLIVFEKRLGALSDNISWADRLVQLNKKVSHLSLRGISVFRLSARMRFSPPFYKYWTTPNWWKMVKLEDQFYWEVDQLSSEAIAKLTSKDAPEDNKIKFASKLINKPNLSHTDIKTILLSLFSDGLSTTAPSLIYSLYLLAKNGEAQRTLRNELKAVNPNRAKWTPEMLNRLPFLRACLKESFRMMTITTEISRVPQKDIVLSGYRIPAGTPVEVHTSILLRSSDKFTNADEFKPSRWLRESAEREGNQPFLQTPFGHGPRMCAGRRFAEQDLLVVLASLVSTYNIEHLHEPIKQIYETLLLPSGDCRFKFTPIEQEPR